MELDFKEYEKLERMLTEAHIPHKTRKLWEGKQIGYPDFPETEDCICSAYIHEFSWGNEKGLLEAYGLTDVPNIDLECEGYLTAEEIFNRIEKDYNERGEEKDVKES